MNNFPYAQLGLAKTLDEVRAETFNQLEEVHAEYAAKDFLPQSLNLNRGPARGLLELHNFGRHRLHEKVSALFPECFAATASGTWLDLHCADILLFRKPALQAQGLVEFFRDDAAGNLKIPAGRLVRTKPDGRGEVYRFLTTSEVLIPEGALNAKAPVIAENYGWDSNVTAGAICEIVTSIMGVSGVRNLADWLAVEGANEENDESLRQRYYLKWMSISGLNKYFYQSLALSVPGVMAAKILDQHPRGQGTVDIIIKGAAGLPTENLLAQVATLVADERPQNDDVLVKSPNPVTVKISLKLEIIYGDHAEIKLTAENYLRPLFQSPAKNTLQIGEDVTHSRIISECMKVPGVKKVLIEKPEFDVDVPPDGLALLEALEIETIQASA